MVWSEGNTSLKNPVTTPGIDPGTVRLVAQRLNHYDGQKTKVETIQCRENGRLTNIKKDAEERKITRSNQDMYPATKYSARYTNRQFNTQNIADVYNFNLFTH